MALPVYLDHNATTPLDPAVLEAMLPWLESRFGNASSRHEYGRAARQAVDEARQQVAAAVGAHPTEVVFTSGGGGEQSVHQGRRGSLKPGGIAFGASEHPCVLKPAAQLARQGWRLHPVAVDAEGRVDSAAYAGALAAKPALLSLMLANNETGVLSDVAALAEQARTGGAGSTPMRCRRWASCRSISARSTRPACMR